MPFIQRFAIASCLLAVPVLAQSRGREARAAPELEHGTFESHSFPSEAIGGKARYGVYLPEGYGGEANAERRYPLVVWLHGLNEDDSNFHTRGGTRVLDELIGKGEIPEMVFVTPDAGRSFYINGGESRAYEDLITVDLLEHLEKTYRIAPGKDQRALMGVSMGGYGAIKIGLKHPDRFGVVAAHSAAVMPRDPEQLDEAFPWLERRGRGQRMMEMLFGEPLEQERWEAENVLILAERVDPADLSGLKLYLDCGDEDRYGFAKPNAELHRILEEKKVPHTWRLVEGGNHGWRSGYNQEQLPHSLRFVAAAWAAHQGAAGLDGLLDGDAKKRGEGGK